MNTEQEDKIDKEVGAMERATITMARATIFIAIITALTFISTSIFSYIQYHEMEKALVSSDSTTKGTFDRMESIINAFKTTAKSDSIIAGINKKSVDISDSSLGINKTALGFSEKSFEVQNRAFVEFTNVTIPKLEVGKKLECVFYFTNYGRTPAYIIGHTVNVLIYDDITAKKIINSDIKHLDADLLKEPSENITTIGTNKEFTYVPTSPVAISQDIIDAVNSGKFKFYAFGAVIYKDFFGKRHYVHFCGAIHDNEIKLGGSYNGAD